jgi:hypothetical protein
MPPPLKLTCPACGKTHEMSLDALREEGERAAAVLTEAERARRVREAGRYLIGRFLAPALQRLPLARLEVALAEDAVAAEIGADLMRLLAAPGQVV